MIFIKIDAQLGNQLFQYAFAMSSAKKNDTFFIAYKVSQHFHIKFFKLDPFTNFLYCGNKYIVFINTFICRQLVKVLGRKTIKDPEHLLVNTYEDYVLYEGYFQSEDYFVDYINEIKLRFQLKGKFINIFNMKYGDFFKKNKTIVIHFRRMDYGDVEFDSLGGKGYILPLDYYLKSMSLIGNINSYEIFFIGDDMGSVKNDFEGKSNYHFEMNSSIVDFQLIQNADIAIIANSTFAWWAAYLSLKPNSRIIAPKYWLGFKVDKTFPPGIETQKFEWINWLNQ